MPAKQQWPADKIKRRKVAELIPYARNARTHSPEQVAQIAASIKEWGFTNPVLIDETDGIIAGHGRVLAAQLIGLVDVPAMTATGWTEAQKRAYVIADNKLALNAGWDNEMLAVEFGDLAALDFDLTLTGFGELELADLMADKTLGLTDPDDVPPVPEQPITVTGDVWLLGKHRLRCGDSTSADDVAALLAGVEPELLVTSPPYNQKINKFKPSGMHAEPADSAWVKKVATLSYADDMPESEYQAWQSELLVLWHGVLKDGASVFYNHKVRYRDKTAVTPLEWLPGPFNLRQEVIWSRPGSVTQNARMFLPCDERIYWMTKGKGFFFNDTTEIKTWSSVWKIGLETNKTHAVGFPVELPRRCILACSAIGGAVYEPFSGSGTTIIAGEMESRSIYAMELAENYCDVAVTRWQNFTGLEATLESTGETFNAIAAKREAA